MDSFRSLKRSFFGVLFYVLLLLHSTNGQYIQDYQYVVSTISHVIFTYNLWNRWFAINGVVTRKYTPSWSTLSLSMLTTFASSILAENSSGRPDSCSHPPEFGRYLLQLSLYAINLSEQPQLVGRFTWARQIARPICWRGKRERVCLRYLPRQGRSQGQ